MSKKKNNRVLSDRPPKKTVDLRETVTDWYLVLMLLVYCLWCPMDYSDVGAPKFYFFAVTTLLWFVMLVIFSFGEGLPTGLFTPARIAAIVFAGVCLLSAIVSPYKFGKSMLLGYRYSGLLTQLLLVLILIGVSRFGHCKERHFIAFGISITIFSVICILQKLGYNPLGFYGGKGHINNYLGTIGNIDTVSALISLSVLLFLGLSVEREAPYDKLYLIPLFFSSLTLTLCGADSGLLGVAAASVVTPAILIRSMKDLRRTLGRVALALIGAALGSTIHSGMRGDVFYLRFEFGTLAIACVILAAVFGAASWLLRFVPWEPSARMFRNAFIGFAVFAVIGALTVLWLWPGESGTIYEASQILHGHFEDSYGTWRIGIWRKTLAKIPDRPLLGYGPQMFEKLKISTKPHSLADRAHNVYLNYLAETGVLGLLSYLAVIVTSLFVRRHGRLKQVSASLTLAALSYAAQDFFNLGLPITSAFFWIILALLQTETHEKQETAAQ